MGMKEIFAEISTSKSQMMILSERIDTIVENAIDSIGQNPKIKNVNGNSYTINVSDLTDDLNLHSRHYDFRWWKNCLKSELSKKADKEKYLIEVMKTGKIGSMKMNPDFYEELKKVFK